MALGRLPLGTLVTGTKGSVPKRGLWSQACLANLAENTPVTLLASVEMATEVSQKRPGTLAGQAWGKLLGAGWGVVSEGGYLHTLFHLCLAGLRYPRDHLVL